MMGLSPVRRDCAKGKAQEVTEGLLTLRGFGSNSDNLPDI
jgi:hypothetical protein